MEPPEINGKNELKLMMEEQTTHEEFLLDDGKLIWGDSRQLSEYIQEGSIDFVITSPPYWAIRDYGVINQIGYGQAYDEYIGDMKRVFKECYDALKEQRWLAINVGTVVSKEGMKFLSGDIVKICEEIGFTFRKDIIWYKPRGQTKWQRGGTQFIKAPYPRHYNTNINHEFILLFSKGEVLRNGLDEANEVCSDYIEYNRQYIRTVAYSVWDITPVNSPRLDEKHAAPFPEELPQRLIELFTFPGETVLDPFSGAGTALRMAKKLGRRYTGVDLNRKYVLYSIDRLKEIETPPVPEICKATSTRYDESPSKKLKDLEYRKKTIEKEIRKIKEELYQECLDSFD